MNREIRYRGQRVDNGEWIYGFLFELNADGSSVLCIGTEPLSANDYSEIYSSCYGEVIPETVGQYTGECIPDTTEKVYEHDIIEQSYISKLNDKRVVKKYLIAFEKGHYIAKCIGHSPYGDTLLHFMLANYKYFDTKIIGNKTDNPELLEASNGQH